MQISTEGNLHLLGMDASGDDDEGDAAAEMVMVLAGS